MNAHRPIDATTRIDLHRLRTARRAARAAVAGAEARCAATVRSASPVLMSLVEVGNLTLGDIVDRLAPTPGWPSRPRLSRVVGRWGREPHALRHALALALAAVAVGHLPKKAEMLRAAEFPLDGGGRALVNMVGRGLEVKARIGAATFETRHGELRITVPGSLPLTLAAGAAVRLLDDLLPSTATAGRGWRVADVEQHRTTTVVIVMTGNIPCAIE